NTKPWMSSRRTAPYHQIVALLHTRIGDRWAELELAQQPDERRTARAGGCGLGDRAHRVNLLLRHRQAQQQLLVRDTGAEARACALEAHRLCVAEGLRLRQ